MTLPPTSAQPTPMPERQRVDVVVHTHWDREWYMDRETTLARLEVVMGRVLADLDAGRLQQFLFDGQTVALEDLASQAPAALMQGLKAHAQAGRLVLGPWYVASDEFLVSGESLLRNLALGLEQARAWGRRPILGLSARHLRARRTDAANPAAVRYRPCRGVAGCRSPPRLL